MKYFLVVLVILLSYSCSCNCSTNISNDRLIDVSKEKYGKDFELIFNQEKSYAISLNRAKPSSKNTQPTISFFVFDLQSSEIVFEKTNLFGTVAWLNNNQFEMTTIPGIVQYDDPAESHTVIYDLKLKKEIVK